MLLPSITITNVGSRNNFATSGATVLDFLLNEINVDGDIFYS